jgi:hypothetical protein
MPMDEMSAASGMCSQNYRFDASQPRRDVFWVGTASVAFSSAVGITTYHKLMSKILQRLYFFVLLSQIDYFCGRHGGWPVMYLAQVTV